jgi:hypothetical protein
MREFFGGRLIRVLAPTALAAAGSAVLTSSAWAGADDGGSKAFYMVPDPGSYAGAPATAAQPRYAAPQRDEVGPTATFNDKAYESYRTPPRHYGRYHIPTN